MLRLPYCTTNRGGCGLVDVGEEGEKGQEGEGLGFFLRVVGNRVAQLIWGNCGVNAYPKGGVNYQLPRALWRLVTATGKFAVEGARATVT
jgi:hypothetical protein